MRGQAVALGLILVGGGVEHARGAPVANELLEPAGRSEAAALRTAKKYYDARNYAAAIPEFDKVLELQPRFAAAITMRGFSYAAIGEHQLARRDHDAVLKLAPQYPNSWVNACWARAEENVELQLALERCDAVIRKRPSAGGFDARGFVHYRLGAYPAALADYNQALELEPRQASSLYMRGVVRLRMGDAETGRKDIARATRINKQMADIYRKRGVEP